MTPAEAALEDVHPAAEGAPEVDRVRAIEILEGNPALLQDLKNILQALAGLDRSHSTSVRKMRQKGDLPIDDLLDVVEDCYKGDWYRNSIMPPRPVRD